MIALMLLNPVDLARVLLLMQLDVAALMGYTGAVFQRFFGSDIGTAVVMTALATWVAAPVLLGLRAFNRRDF
jgi:Cu-processing system permease protein